MQVEFKVIILFILKKSLAIYLKKQHTIKITTKVYSLKFMELIDCNLVETTN